MKKLMIMILCLLVVGVVTADAQKRKSYKVKSTQKRVVKKKVPVDSVVIFSYLEEHGVVTTGVQLRRKGNDYLLTAVETNDIRIDMERAIALSKEITSERLANGYLEMEMARSDDSGHRHKGGQVGGRPGGFYGGERKPAGNGVILY